MIEIHTILYKNLQEMYLNNICSKLHHSTITQVKFSEALILNNLL